MCIATHLLTLLLASHLIHCPSFGRSDADGRERYFHGTNCVVKGPPYHPDPDNFDTLVSLTDRDFAILADAGVNVIRLGMMWPGVEPQPGQYNYTYLGVISRIAAGAAKHGIYTLLDMHQARAAGWDEIGTGKNY
jgi:endoglycosylceramidase